VDKVEPRGIEPLAASAERKSSKGLAPTDPQPLAQTLARETSIDPELARVIEAWPDLPQAIRRALLALIDTACG
jgi:hypothetical protein